MKTRDIDAQIAATVFGWQPEALGLARNMDGALRFMLNASGEKQIAAATEALLSVKADGGQLMPYYSTSLSAAWEIVEWMQAGGWNYSLSATKPDLHECAFGEFREGAESAPLAICRAALRALAPRD